MKKTLLLTLVAVFIASFANAQLPIEKDFNDNSMTSGNWEAISVIGDQVWDADNTYGIDGTACGQMSGYDGQAYENEDWLVSPSINADNYSTITLNFWNTSGYTGNALEAHWSNDYSGDPSTATWTEITGITWHDGVTFWEWINSGDIDMSAMSGNCVIGFKFTSTSTESATWELDDISITGTVGINETEIASVNVFPNPTADFINISNIDVENVKIANITGQVVKVAKTNKVDVKDLANGLYFITVEDANGAIKTGKFLKK